MRIKPELLAIPALTAVVVAFAVEDARPVSALDSPRTIELVAGRPAHETFVDVGKKGGGVGDSFVSTGVRLRDVATRQPAGHLDVLGTIANPKANYDFVAVTARLRTGTIQVNGVMRHNPRTTVLPVTGGTGEYANARGTLSLTERTGRATFNLLP